MYPPLPPDIIVLEGDLAEKLTVSQLVSGQPCGVSSQICCDYLDSTGPPSPLVGILAANIISVQ